MKKFVFALLSVSLLVMVVAAVTVSAGGRPVHQVSGGGKLVKDDGSFDTLSFVVKIDDEGVVKGQGGINAHGWEYLNHWEPDCLVVDGNEAWIGATVTHSNVPVTEGSKFTLHLRVEDDGVLISYPADGYPGDEINPPRPYKPCNEKPDLITDLGSNLWQIGEFKIR